MSYNAIYIYTYIYIWSHMGTHSLSFLGLVPEFPQPRSDQGECQAGKANEGMVGGFQKIRASLGASPEQRPES